MHDVFFALADPIRRHLLERLHEAGGQTVRQLGTGLTISRQGLTKHLAVLEGTRLVVAKRVGRRGKRHFISTKPIEHIVGGWLAKFHTPASTGVATVAKKTRVQRRKMRGRTLDKRVRR